MPTYDAQWSTEVLIDDAGAEQASYKYRAFGLVQREQGQASTKMTFAGKQGYYRDEELGLYFLGSANSSGGGRSYDPTTGRFLSEDPAKDDLNEYRYVRNNPINVIDPSGEACEQANAINEPVYGAINAGDSALLVESAPVKEDAPADNGGEQTEGVCGLNSEIQCTKETIQKELDEINKLFTGAADTAGGVFNDLPEPPSLLELIWEMGNPLKRARNLKNCICYLRKVVKFSTVGHALECGSKILLPFWVKWLANISTVPDACWRFAADLLGKPASNKFIDRTSWLLESLDNPCFKAMPGGLVLAEVADTYDEKLMEMAAMLDNFVENFDVYRDKVIKWVTDRVNTVAGCVKNLWDKVSTIVATQAQKTIGGVVGGAAGGVLGEIASKTVCILADTISQSVTDLISKPQEWIEAVTEGIDEALAPFKVIPVEFQKVTDGVGGAISNFRKGEFSAAGSCLKQAFQGVIDIVDSLGLYIYLITIAVPGAIGTIVPGAGNAAGVTIGQTINTVISGVRGVIGAALDIVDVSGSVTAMWNLIKDKIKEAEDLAKFVMDDENATMDDLLDDAADASKIPIITFEEEDIQTIAGFVASIISSGFFGGVQLLLSLLGTFANKIAVKFRQKFGKKVRQKSKRSADKRCRKCGGGKAKGKKKTCFPAGTAVSTEYGLRPIEEIEAGSLVWAFDFEQQAWSLARVYETYETDYQGDLITLRIGDEVIQATGGHPFWVVDGEGLANRPRVAELAHESHYENIPGSWVLARDLKAGDCLRSRNGEVSAVASVQSEKTHLATYNFHVEELHNYAVGECGTLVHNVSCPRAKPCDTKAVKTLIRRCNQIRRTKTLTSCEAVRDKIVTSCKQEALFRRKVGGRPDWKNCPTVGNASCCWPRKKPATRTNSGTLGIRLGILEGLRVSNQPEAHHIVPGGHPQAAKARQVLEEACIGINDAVNGVWLPKTSNSSKNYRKRVFHNYTMQRAYIEYIRVLFAGLSGEDEVLAALSGIQAKLESGKAPWIKTPNFDPTAPTP